MFNKNRKTIFVQLRWYGVMMGAQYPKILLLDHLMSGHSFISFSLLFIFLFFSPFLTLSASNIDRLTLTPSDTSECEASSPLSLSSLFLPLYVQVRYS